tara:strand:- start:930 stop:2072 length:1143 start_codon:yes stop_codon:yes gene_type:complete
MQQKADAFPLEQRARNLANQRVALSNAIQQEQRVARLDALELGNEAAAQNLWMQREKHDIALDDAELRWQQGQLNIDKTHQDIAEQKIKMDKEAEYQRQRPALNNYIEEINQMARDGSIDGSVTPSEIPPPSEYGLVGRARTEAMVAFQKAQEVARTGVAGQAEKNEQDYVLKLVRDGLLDLESTRDPKAVREAKFEYARNKAKQIAAELGYGEEEAADIILPEDMHGLGPVYGTFLQGGTYHFDEAGFRAKLMKERKKPAEGLQLFEQTIDGKKYRAQDLSFDTRGANAARELAAEQAKERYPDPIKTDEMTEAQYSEKLAEVAAIRAAYADVQYLHALYAKRSFISEDAARSAGLKSGQWLDVSDGNRPRVRTLTPSN